MGSLLLHDVARYLETCRCVHTKAHHHRVVHKELPVLGGCSIVVRFLRYLVVVTQIPPTLLVLAVDASIITT